MKTIRITKIVAAILAGFGAQEHASAQLIINDTLTGASSSYNWSSLNGACLTAGNGSGTIPKCVGLPYYSGRILVGGVTGRLPDPVGRGALRLTNGDVMDGGSNGDGQTGAVVSNFTFPTNQGLNVTFTTATYGGDNLNGHGADGISFYLMDGSLPPSVGALGGSLGYSCSNGNGTYDGVTGGYIAIGIDEFGNFSNPGDNTDTGPGFSAGRISIRGAGDTAWQSLSIKYPTYYPANLSPGLQADAVHNTCRTGYVWNYSGKKLSGVSNQNQSAIRLPFNYPLIKYSDLPNSVQIANQQGVDPALRTSATPITYALQLTQDGILDVSYSVAGGTAVPVVQQQSISSSNGPIPSSFRFGFSSGTGGGNNVHEITCFKAAPVSAANSSAGTNVQSGRVISGAQVYLGYYHPTNWWGQLTAQNLLDGGNTVSVSSVANWDASCVLTGGACAATGSSNSAESSSSRQILSWSGTTGIPFQWSSLTSSQQVALTAGDATSSDKRLRYLRGDRSTEVASGGTLRSRTGVFGDLIDSSPTTVGAPTLPYQGPWQDALYPAAVASESAYSSFKASYATRQNVVYVGANDGLMHGFRAGSYDATGAFVTNSTTPNDGLEVLAFVPAAVVSAIHSTTAALDYTSTQYSHNLYVDATPGTGDLYYSGAWHTWLVSGLGPARNSAGPIGNKTDTAAGSIFALDVTNPAQFNESNAASLVVGEWSPASISCSNVVNCGNSLGGVSGTPIIRRLHNGKWSVIFGNGLNSSTGTAGIFLMLIDPTNGAKTFHFIDTGVGPSGDPLGLNSKNGIVAVSSADFDGDHVTDFVYAGDVFGNLWRFDLTSQIVSAWTAGTGPIFKTTAGQPITTRVNVSTVPSSGPGARPRVIVSFGTGQQLPQTLTGAASYASGDQSLYGIWDWNFLDWNTVVGSAATLASLPKPQTVNPTVLQTQDITGTLPGSGAVSGYRTVSNNVVCWKGSTTCATNNDKFGWKMSFPSVASPTSPTVLRQEQIIYNPITERGIFIVNTLIPEAASALTCGVQPPSGYTMAISVAGGGDAASVFPDPNNNFATYPNGAIGGIGLGGTGTPSIVTTQNGSPNLLTQTNDGTAKTSQVRFPDGSGRRVNWERFR